ncbi:MAG TPA: type II toxin-antitoxin system VapC family toxin [Blastocatellia bacterium]|nr:type II toxin-antitoxin system VapC family toxin [Blastocatellia bacterium]HMX28852.1 type II toxin-antitoxin system VapC family toxin [Blastocatellia bacterium]HMY72815.1 type II toxin-antitoxin system VapC family toxin [Blastocatellia bacterium]HMZ20645.1 type II toxin-antitoxin system VapC family toxin [Blastocatellia bacterium]HNG29333.1 type II toxin-antitoxin system VapC family toxin [Blastocatellia bacterium]
MSYAIDTNLLTRSIQEGHPMQAAANNALETLRLRHENLCVLAQNLYEFWGVATRPTQYNGLGLSTAEAQAELTRIKSLFRLLPETPTIYGEWEKLVTQYAVAGKNSHDARIVAAMRIHGVSHLLTFNVADFKRFKNLITVFSPSEITDLP